MKKTPDPAAFVPRADTELAAELSKRSFLRTALLGGAALTIGPALAQAPARGGTLTIGADADPIGLDPTVVTAFSSFDFISLLYTGVLRWNAAMKVEPDLAVSFEQPDAKTYVFKLREGVKFHNGQDFSARGSSPGWS